MNQDSGYINFVEGKLATVSRHGLSGDLSAYSLNFKQLVRNVENATRQTADLFSGATA